MEQKKAEMFDAKDDGKLAEWMDGSSKNHNVFYYYQSLGEISFPPEYDRPFFEDDFRYHLQSFTQGWLLFVWIGVSAGLMAGTAVFMVRKRK
jgi:LPXTG-motif cell wall-anchored protein